MTEGKICYYCLIFKSFNLFRKSSTCIDGYRRKCKDCERPMKQKHYLDNKEKYKKSYQEFLLRNPNYQNKYYLANQKLSFKNGH